MCDYSCNLNIKMKKHISREHAGKSNNKNSCNFCDFTAISVVDIWKHKIDKHAGESSDTTNSSNRNSFVINMIAEQNIHLLEEFSKLKKNFKDILEQFSYDADDHAKELKDHASKQNIQTANALKVLTKEVITLQKSTPQASPSSPTPSSLPTPRTVQTPSTTSSQNASSTKSSRTSKRQKSKYQAKQRVLVVGDSFSQRFNFRKLEAVTNSTIRTAKSQGSVGNLNVADVARDMLEKEQFDRLVVSAPAIDIPDHVMSNLKPSDDMEALKEKIKTSCINTLKTAENALAEHNTLKNITIVSHSLNSDNGGVDPMSLLYNLASFANRYLLELWLSSPHKDKIFIGSPDKPTYFESVLNVLMSSFNINPAQTKNDHTYSPQPIYNKLNKDDHTNCPQAVYMRSSRRKYSTVLAGEAPLKTSNRFFPLSQMQGNF